MKRSMSTGPLTWFEKRLALPIINDALKRHGLPKNTEPWQSGTYSNVYKLADGTLLRLASVPLEKYTQPDKFVAMAKQIRNLSGDQMPKCFFEQNHHVTNKDKTITFGIINETVTELVDKVHISEWCDYFTTPNALLIAALGAGAELFRRGIVHRDISDGNMLLNKTTTKFQFIDNDDACIYPNGLMCKIGSVEYGFGTEGFALPSIDKLVTSFRAHMALYHAVTGFPVRPHEVAESESRAYKKNPHLQLLHNMVHAIIIVAMQAISRAESGKKFVRNKRYWTKLPGDWQAFLARTCTPVAPDRFDFPEALKAAQKLTPLVWTGKKGVAIRRSVLSRRSSPLLAWSKPTATRPASPTLQNPITGRMIMFGKVTHRRLCKNKQLPEKVCTTPIL